MVKSFLFNHYEVNCYLVGDEATRQCAIVDPACVVEDDFKQLAQCIDELRLTPTMVLLTHPHVDHLAGLQRVCATYGLPVTMHAEGIPLLATTKSWGQSMGFAVDNLDGMEVREVADGEVLHLGQTEVECRYVPGHCPGSLCFVVAGEKAVLTGDALFHFSIGRTDLPGGDYATLIEKIKRRILTLPDDYTVLPGHGIPSVIWKERSYNPFLAE